MVISSLPVKGKEQEKTSDVKSGKGESACCRDELFHPVTFSLILPLYLLWVDVKIVEPCGVSANGDSQAGGDSLAGA